MGNYVVCYPNSTPEWSRLKAAILRFTRVQSRTQGRSGGTDSRTASKDGFFGLELRVRVSDRNVFT